MREVGLAPVDLGCLVCAGTWVLIAWDARGIIERSKKDLSICRSILLYLHGFTASIMRLRLYVFDTRFTAL